MDIFNPAINHTFRVPDDATPDEINGIIGSVEQQAQSRAGILGGLGAVGRMVQSLDAPHYPTVDPVAAMAMTPQALNATLQRQAESRQQQEAIAQRERESTAQALQQEKDRRVRLQVMQQQMKNDEADRKIREQQMALQERQINASIEQDQARTEAAKRPQVKPLGTGGSYMVTDPLTGEVKYVASEYDRQYQQARLNRESRMGTGGGRDRQAGMVGPNGEEVYWDQRGGWTYIDSTTKMPVRFGSQAPDPLDPDRDRRQQAYVDAVKALGRQGVADAADLQEQARIMSETMFPVPKERKPYYGKRMTREDFAAMPESFRAQFLGNGGEITNNPAQATEGPTSVRMRNQSGAPATVQSGPPPGLVFGTQGGQHGAQYNGQFYTDAELRERGWL